MKDSQFKVEYDDQPDEVVDAVSRAIRKFNLQIIDVESQDGYVIYEVVEIQQKEQQS